MGSGPRRISPFVKQCFVCSGVTLNLAGHGLSNGFAAILLSQLNRPGSEIPIDDTSSSWVVSVSGFSLVVGNFVIPIVMGKYGRRNANMTSIVPMILGWVIIAVATNIHLIIFARVLHGLSMGMGTSLGPILIGEYTSPKNRGAFLTVISVMISAGVLVAQVLGSYLHWQTTAVVCAFISLANLVIVLLSPESPSWLTDKGKHEESKKVFRWLRGDGEEQELERMIEATIDRKTKINVKDKLSMIEIIKEKQVQLSVMMRSKEFYKPILIMIHIYTLSQWAGVNVLINYTWNLLQELIGRDIDLAAIIITLDAQRVASNLIGVYLIKKKKRRSMLLAIGLLAIFAMLSTALYSYLRVNSLLPYDHPMIGVVFTHIHMLSIGIGTVPFCYIVAGELFPLRYKSIAGGISVLFHSISYFAVTKPFPFLIKTIGVHGAYCIYAGVVSYCLMVAWWLLPETKDKTLREIEDEFRGPTQNVNDVELLQMGTRP